MKAVHVMCNIRKKCPLDDMIGHIYWTIMIFEPLCLSIRTGSLNIGVPIPLKRFINFCATLHIDLRTNFATHFVNRYLQSVLEVAFT